VPSAAQMCADGLGQHSVRDPPPIQRPAELTVAGRCGQGPLWGMSRSSPTSSWASALRREQPLLA